MSPLISKAYKCSLYLDNKLFVSRPRLVLVASTCFAVLAAVFIAYRPFSNVCALVMVPSSQACPYKRALRQTESRPLERKDRHSIQGFPKAI